MEQRPLAHALYRVDDDRDHRRCEPGEQARDQRGRACSDIQRGERKQGHDTRQYEQDAGDQTSGVAVQKPADVDGELLGFGAGKQHAVVQGVQEPLLADPLLLVHQLVLHHRDLPGGSTEGLQTDREPGAGGFPQRDQVALPGGRGRHRVSVREVRGFRRAGSDAGRHEPRRRSGW